MTADERKAVREALLIGLMILNTEAIAFVSTTRQRGNFPSLPFYHGDAVPSPDESIIQWQTWGAHYLPESADVLFLGDSSCLTGIVPAQFTERTGLSARNLGTLGWLGLRGHADILKTYLEAHRPPRLLIYAATYYPFTVRQSELDRLGVQKRFRLWLSTARPFPPSAGYRRALAAEVDALLHGLVPIGSHTPRAAARGSWPSDQDIRRLLSTNHGYLPDPSGAAKNVRGRHTLPAFSPDCLPGLAAILETAGRHGLPVWVVMNPLPDFSRSEATSASLESIKAGLQDAGRKWRNLELFTPFQRYYPDDLCASLAHLTPVGARRNTEEIADWLKEHVNLPDGRNSRGPDTP